MVYHANALPHVTLTWFDLPIDTGAIRDTALLTIEGGRDDIAGPGQCRVAHDLCPGIPKNKRGHRLLGEIGHFSLFHGTSWHTHVRPLVEDFLHQ
jgi:poly(3-hydroxybutyrate) depolymerase